MSKHWWTTTELADEWQVSRETIWTLIKQKRLRAQKLGNRYRVHDTARVEFEQGAVDPDQMRHPDSRGVA